MLKIAKISASILILYIHFYVQVWGDNYILLYGSAIFTVLSVAVYCMQTGRLSLSHVPFGVWNNLIIFVYALITSAFVAYDYMAALEALITFAAYSMVIIAICYISSEEGSIEWVLKVLIALAVICTVYSFFKGATWRGYGKTLSSTNNPHDYAAVMNLGIFSVAFVFKKEQSKVSVLSVILISVFFYSIIGCGSRKYLIASACIIGIWAFASFKDEWRTGDLQKKFVIVLFCVTIVSIGVYLFYRVFLNSLSYRRFSNSDDMGNQNRVFYYKKAWEIFLAHPFFGGGYDQFRYLSGAGVYAHSTYAEAIADFGLIGCALYFPPIIFTSFRLMYSAFRIEEKTLLLEKSYKSWLLFAFCFAELFLAAGQVYFVDFHHFLSWMILFYYARELINFNPEEMSISVKYSS